VDRLILVTKACDYRWGIEYFSGRIEVRRTTTMQPTPGTVSKILWHFTGGPLWNCEKNCQESRPKPAQQAYEILVSILRSRQLRTGRYREVVKVLVPERKVRNPTTKQFEVVKDSVVTVESVPVCCLADIPIAHLSYHAQRYGRFALGFRREAALQRGFNPVFYVPHNTDVLRSIYEGHRNIGYIDPDEIESAASDIETALSGLECVKGHEVDVDVSSELRDIELAASTVRDSAEKADEALQDLLAFVKSFDLPEFSTIYCEREWRSISPFDFDWADLAMVVLPKEADSQSFFDRFLGVAQELGLPRSLPVVPWEDLLEH
jgi:hypothetical protein